MSRPKSGLGRGLGAIIPNETAAAAPASGDDAGGQLRSIPVGEIQANEYQPRDRFNEEDLESLTESIRELGVLQPVLVRQKSEGTYELIAGERRWRAAQRAGLTVVPAVVREADDKAALEQAVVENLHRADLNAIEEAAAFRQLIDEFSMTQDEVAQRVGKSRSAVANALRLFQLPANVQRMVIDGELSAGHGRALLACDAADLQSFAQRAVDEQMSVRALEGLVKGRTPSVADEPISPAGTTGGGDGPSVPSEPPPAAIVELEQLLGDHLETRVKLSVGGSRGKMVVDFADIDDLERIFGLMTGQQTTN